MWCEKQEEKEKWRVVKFSVFYDITLEEQSTGGWAGTFWGFGNYTWSLLQKAQMAIWAMLSSTQLASQYQGIRYLLRSGCARLLGYSLLYTQCFASLCTALGDSSLKQLWTTFWGRRMTAASVDSEIASSVRHLAPITDWYLPTPRNRKRDAF